MLKVQKISREVVIDPSETTRQAPCGDEIKAYLLGALHDASLNKGKRYRFTQKGKEWIFVLKELFQEIGYNSWIYRETNRDVYTLETLAGFLDFKFNPLNLKTDSEISAYVRGFFDAEGGIPRNKEADFYIQLVQKDKDKIKKLSSMLSSLGISTGKMHNPSKRVDPNYWRIYVSWKSHKDFACKIGSWHPRKAKIFQTRVMI
ncbi:MAG: hypothetical protein MRY49_03260 [Candidatus Pacebacteria bacterium]|nr:hypothetical protein [Candidatus Paceibacterota bacterium]